MNELEKAKRDLKTVEALLGMIKEFGEELVAGVERGEQGHGACLSHIKEALLEIVGCEEMEDGRLE